MPKGNKAFRKGHYTCRTCENDDGYASKLKHDTSFLQNHAEKLRAKHRTKDGCAATMLNNAKRRARAVGLPFTITKSDIVIPEICPVLGIKLQVSSRVVAPGSPTLDRTNNDAGYVPGNVQVISMRANTMKNNATLEEVEKLYFWLKAQQKQKL